MSGTPTFQDQVNTVVGQMTTDDKGNAVIPEGVEVADDVLYAAKLEKRHRDTQSAYTKSQQENKRLKAENNALASNWEADAVSNLPATEQARLEELKTQDPDLWREEITTLETKQKEEFATRRTKVSETASAEVELASRQASLDAYNKANPERPLTDEVISNDIPPRITKKLETGEISFDEFVKQCDKYLTTPKVVKKEDDVDPEPGFAQAGGSSTPSEAAVEAQNKTDYSKEIF